MKIHEKLQLHAEEMKNKRLERDRKNMPQKRRRDLHKKRMIPFFFYEPGTVHVMVDFLTDLGEMLSNTNWSIEKICENMNYSNRKHFEKYFQELFCQTPYQYRKNLDSHD